MIGGVFCIFSEQKGLFHFVEDNVVVFFELFFLFLNLLNLFGILGKFIELKIFLSIDNIRVLRVSVSEKRLELGMTKGLLEGLVDLIVQVLVFLGLDFLLFVKLFARLVCLVLDIRLVNSLNDDPVRHSLSRGKTAAIVFYNSCDVS
jgi:hypothetical protein